MSLPASLCITSNGIFYKMVVLDTGIGLRADAALSISHEAEELGELYLAIVVQVQFLEDLFGCVDAEKWAVVEDI